MAGRAEADGKWKAGNLVKKACETMVQGEVSSFLIKDEVVDKFGNAPFWGKGQVKLEIALLLVSRDEDLNSDGGVVKHMLVPGEGYEKPTDGALVTYHYTIYPVGVAAASRVREEDPRAGAAGERQGPAARATVDYAKWSNFDLTDDEGNVEGAPGGEPLSGKVLEALEASKKAAESRGGALYSTRGGAGAQAFVGYAETCEGLDDGLMTMRKGEVAIFTINTTYGFSSHVRPEGDAGGGDAGPADLAEGTYQFEVEVVSIDKGREHWNLDAENKAKFAEVKKGRGNDFFKKGFFGRALKLYTPIINTFFMKMPQRPSDAVAAAESKGCGPQVLRPLNAPPAADDESAEEKELRTRVQLPVLLNLAACK